MKQKWVRIKTVEGKVVPDARKIVTEKTTIESSEMVQPDGAFVRREKRIMIKIESMEMYEEGNYLPGKSRINILDMLLRFVHVALAFIGLKR